jgi:hypothetical protein
MNFGIAPGLESVVLAVKIYLVGSIGIGIGALALWLCCRSNQK